MSTLPHILIALTKISVSEQYILIISETEPTDQWLISCYLRHKVTKSRKFLIFSISSTACFNNDVISIQKWWQWHPFWNALRQKTGNRLKGKKNTEYFLFVVFAEHDLLYKLFAFKLCVKEYSRVWSRRKITATECIPKVWLTHWRMITRKLITVHSSKLYLRNAISCDGSDGSVMAVT